MCNLSLVGLVTYCNLGCAIEICEQCKLSDKDVLGECTKCIPGTFTLRNGTCINSE